MVVWVTKSKDAERLMQEGILQIEGEATYTRIFEQRTNPVCCHKCQKYDHQAFCSKDVDPTCGKCALKGHSHQDTETSL